MILNNAINAGGFIYCAAYFGPHEDYTYFNDGSGHHHQYSYIVEGSAIIQMRKTPGKGSGSFAIQIINKGEIVASFGGFVVEKVSLMK